MLKLSNSFLGWLAVCGLIGMLYCGTPLRAVTSIASVLQRAPELNPNLSLYPESTFVDRSPLLDAPAGKHGFVMVSNGHFTFTDGMRARFFGVNLANDTVFIDKPSIDRLAALFARAGVNLVRIHQIDDLNGILDSSHPGQLRADKLDLLDYWVAKLKERGIYLCLDLDDYRTFYEAEGVPGGEKLGRGARPYAVFDEKLIELQQAYARKFLVEHVNHYTNLPYAKDPAVALIEIYDENGLFMRRDDWQKLVEPYKTALQQQWNAWLRYRYNNTVALKAAWTNKDGACALLPEENLEQATVGLPQMTLLDEPPQGTSSPLQAPVRVSDGAQFASDLQDSYLQTMMSYLHEIGVKVPITAVGAQEVLPDLMATAKSTDYIGINYYWDHPSWNEGNDWKLPAYFNLQNPIVGNPTNEFPAWASVSRMPGKPLVVRELGYCFPNPYRGTGMIEAAAYGALLDMDALILFTYDAGADRRTIGYFDIHLDPLRWGLASQASRLFLSGEVKPATRTVGIGYSTVDAYTWKNYASPLYQLAFTSRVVNYTDTAKQHPFDLLITSGRSCGEAWTGNKLLFFANGRHTDLRFQGTSDGLDAAEGYKLSAQRGGAWNFTFSGVGYDVGTKRTIQSPSAFSLADLRANSLTPVATADTAALGFIDPKRKVLGFRSVPEDTVARVALDTLHDWYNMPVTHDNLDQENILSDTGQIDRNVGAGVLTVDTPTIQAVTGDLDTPSALHTSTLKLSTATANGTLVAESLDGKPLTNSTNYLVKMTSKARNDQTSVVASKEGPRPHKLTTPGEAPIRTDGRPTATPTHVELAGKLLLEIGMQDGTWEYLVEPGHALLFLDTGDITVKLPTHAKLVRWHTSNETIDMMPSDESFTVPDGVRYTEIFW